MICRAFAEVGDMALPIHVGAVQYATDIGDETANTDRALHMLDDAAHSCDLVVLPEMSFVGYAPGTSAMEFAEPVPGPMTAIVSEIAVSRNAHICFGIAERDGDRIYNTAVLIGADGGVIGKHRKVRLSALDVGAGFSIGDTPTVFETHLGRIGILIGIEAFGIEIARELGMHKAEMLVVPSMGVAVAPKTVEVAMDAWDITLKSGARYSRCYVIWANKIGFDDEAVALGNSMILDPQGHVLARGGMEEEVVRAIIAVGEGLRAPVEERRVVRYGSG